MARFVFIIGTGRTATVFLKEFFRLNVEKCLAVHEPVRTTKRYSNKYLSGAVSIEQMRKYLQDYAAQIRDRLGKAGCEVFVQVDPWLFGFTELLDSCFDRPFVIHLVRDPLTYIPSHLNRMYKSAFVGFLRDIIPYWKLRGDLVGDFNPSEWAALSQEERMAWYWQKCNGYIDSRSDSLANFKRVRFEDLFANEDEGLRDILSFCGLPAKGGRLDIEGIRTNTAPSRFAPTASWTPELRERVATLCGPLTAKYGYDMGPAAPGSSE